MFPITTMIDKQKVSEIVEEWLRDKDYFLVEVDVNADNKVTVEIDHKDGVWIDDCVALSRYVEERLSRDDEDYELEVGSAGIGQPFRVLQQYINHIGQAVEVLTCDGRKLHAILKDANEDGFTITVSRKVKVEGKKKSQTVEEDLSFKYNEIKYTKYQISFK